MKKLISLGLATLLVLSLSACAVGLSVSTNDPTDKTDGLPTVSDPADNGTYGSVTETKSTPPETPSVVVTDVPTSQYGEESTGDVSEYENGGEVSIVFSADGVSVTGTGAAVVDSPLYGTIVEISKSGTYIVSGRTEKGFLAVSKKGLEVTVVLNGVNIYSPNYAAIALMKKSDVTIILADGSENFLMTGAVYDTSYDEEHEANAALCARGNLTLGGGGSLTVSAPANNGIGSKGTLTITGGTYHVDAANNAVKGNDFVNISGGTFTLVAKGDGIKSDNTEDEGLGYIVITGGTFDIAATEDGIQSSTYLNISGADMRISTGGGASKKRVSGVSSKGLKAETLLLVTSGTYNIGSSDDTLHCNGTVTIIGGEFTLASGDDGIHADKELNISGGRIVISTCYEGVESYDINISGGYINITSTDDGVNVSDATVENPKTAGGMGGRPGQGGAPGHGSAIGGTLRISGGELYVFALKDGIDSNGSMVISGGLIVVFSPTKGGDGALDWDGTATISGGTLIAVDSGGTGQIPTGQGGQTAAKKTAAVAAGAMIVLTVDGVEIVSVANWTGKSYTSFVYSVNGTAANKVAVTVNGKTV